MKAKDYVLKKPNRSARKRVEELERKNWHLTQLMGAILFASEEPEVGFTIPEKDALSVNVTDVEFERTMDEKGRALLTIRIKKLAEDTEAA